jgi:hypothetical protein
MKKSICISFFFRVLNKMDGIGKERLDFSRRRDSTRKCFVNEKSEK